MNVFCYNNALRDFGPYDLYLCVGWLVGDHLLLRSLGPYEKIFIAVYDYSFVFSRHY